MKRLLVFLSALLACVSAHATDVVVLCYHDVRDDVRGRPIQSAPTAGPPGIVVPGVDEHLDPEQYATSTHNLAGHFDWLRAHGYHVISLQQLIDARSGHGTLPDKAVLLTFDDGLRSAYTKVFPLLKAYQYPAVVAVVGAWTDLPADGRVDYGYRPFLRDDFATWDQLREMQDSGLVEIASHTYDQHRGIAANPQGSQIPAVVTHAYRSQTHDYETDAAYAERLHADLARSSDEIRTKLGRAPRAVIWPYGEYTKVSDSIAASVGMPVTFNLGGRPHPGSNGLQDIPRLLMMSNLSATDLSWTLQHPDRKAAVRAVQVDLDYVYDPDPAQQERNLGTLLDRIKALEPTQVWLQAFADPDGDDAAGAVYFPNHRLPMRADLFSRVAWQLRTRCGVEVYAWMPVLAWHLPDAAQQERLEIQPKPGVKPEKPVRLNPFLPETRAIVSDLYEDMARSAPIAGILFHDDAILHDTDELGAQAPPPGAGRTQALIEFTGEMKAHVQQWRPGVSTARNLFAEPVLHPASEAWYAQSLPAFLSAYNEVALMAMPRMENAREPKAWLQKLAHKVTSVSGGMEKTVFELQTVDWSAGHHSVSTEEVTQQVRLLQSRGARHLAYYPDDFAKDHPALKLLRPSFSASNYLPMQR